MADEIDSHTLRERSGVALLVPGPLKPRIRDSTTRPSSVWNTTGFGGAD